MRGPNNTTIFLIFLGFFLYIAIVIWIFEGGPGLMNAISFIETHSGFIQAIILFIGASIAIFQLSSLNRQLKGNSLQQIQLNDREIKTLVFNNPLLSEKAKKDVESEKKLEKYMLLLISHAKHIYLLNNLKKLPEDYWDAVERDLEYSITDPVFKKMWDQTKKYVPDNFREYVDSLVAYT